MMENDIRIEKVFIHKLVFPDEFLQYNTSCLQLSSAHAL